MNFFSPIDGMRLAAQKSVSLRGRIHLIRNKSNLSIVYLREKDLTVTTILVSLLMMTGSLNDL